MFHVVEWGADVTDTIAKLGGDPAPECFALLLRCHGVAVEPTQIQHQFTKTTTTSAVRAGAWHEYTPSPASFKTQSMGCIRFNRGSSF
jgi:hypothetical protein